MRKIFLSLLLFIGLVTLAACDTKKEISVTYEEANTMLESVKTETLLEDVITLKGDFNLEYTAETIYNEKTDSITMKTSGSVELYTKVTSYEDYFIAGKVKFNFSSSYGEIKTTMSINGSLYLIDNILYLDATHKTTTNASGSSSEKTDVIKMKQVDMVTEEKFIEFKASLTTEEDAPLNPSLTADSQFKMYEVKEGHLLELMLDLNELFTDESGFLAALLPSGLSFSDDSFFKIGYTFSDVLEKVNLSLKVNANFKSEDAALPTNTTFKLSGNLYFSTKGTAPKFPTQEALDAYEEGNVKDLLGSMFPFN